MLYTLCMADTWKYMRRESNDIDIAAFYTTKLPLNSGLYVIGNDCIDDREQRSSRD